MIPWLCITSTTETIQWLNLNSSDTLSVILIFRSSNIYSISSWSAAETFDGGISCYDECERFFFFCPSVYFMCEAVSRKLNNFDFCPHEKPHCHLIFARAFSTKKCVLEVLIFVWSINTCTCKMHRYLWIVRVAMFLKSHKFLIIRANAFAFKITH